jgi:hypothetical protein
MLVGRISDLSGRLRGALVNYACHPTTLAWDNTAISPDYIGAMRETIQNETGAPALFLFGCCGDLGPRNQYVGQHEVADRHGRQLGFAALSTLNGMEPSGTRLEFKGAVESGAPLAVYEHRPREVPTTLQAVEAHVDLPMKDWPSADVLEQQRRECPDNALQERLRRKRDIRRGLGNGSTFRLPVHVWRLGDAILTGSLCEAYSLLQVELRRRFPGRAIACMNVINGTVGYLPPAKMYDDDVYTVWQTPFDRGSLELLIECMTNTIGNVLNQ